MKTIEILLAFFVSALVVILVVTWNRDMGNLEMGTNEKNEGATTEEIMVERTYTVSSEEIASLFGWERRYRETSVKKNGAKVIAKGSDIIYLGHIMKSNGQKHFFFKNNKNNDLFSLTEGSQHEGWKLMHIADEGFIFEHENRRYLVNK